MKRVLLDLKKRASRIKLEALSLYFACRDSRTPRLARMLALGIMGYALSPLDLIPDPIPLVGYLDDLGLLFLAFILLPRMIPAEVLIDCRCRACRFPKARIDRVATGLIAANWLITALVVGYLASRTVGP